MPVQESEILAPPQKGRTFQARAADSVVASIEARIVSGKLEDGTPLPTERDLMQQFDASRTVVREAIMVLSSRGLIECKPRFRPIVRKPGYMSALNAAHHIITPLLSHPSGVKNLYETRMFFEKTLVRQAATAARKEDIEALKKVLKANEKSINHSADFYATDIAFHRVLYQIPKNPIFPAIHEGFVSWLAPQWDEMLRSPDRNRMNYKSHEAIYLAIIERDPDEAEEALVNHLQAAWEFVRYTFDDL